MKKRYMIVAPEDDAYDEVYEEVGDGECGDFVCRCSSFLYAKKICDALEDASEKAERGAKGLTLGELITHLKEPDHASAAVDSIKLEVVFDTTYRSDLTLLSCYVSGGKVHIDIGTGEE